MSLIFISDLRYSDQTAKAIRHSSIAEEISENLQMGRFSLLSPQVWNSEEINYKGVNFMTFNEYAGKKILKYLNFCNAIFKMNKEINKYTNKTY